MAPVPASTRPPATNNRATGNGASVPTSTKNSTLIPASPAKFAQQAQQEPNFVTDGAMLKFTLKLLSTEGTDNKRELLASQPSYTVRNILFGTYLALFCVGDQGNAARQLDQRLDEAGQDKAKVLGALKELRDRFQEPVSEARQTLVMHACMIIQATKNSDHTNISNSIKTNNLVIPEVIEAAVSLARAFSCREGDDYDQFAKNHCGDSIQSAVKSMVDARAAGNRKRPPSTNPSYAFVDKIPIDTNNLTQRKIKKKKSNDPLHFKMWEGRPSQQLTTRNVADLLEERIPDIRNEAVCWDPKGKVSLMKQLLYALVDITAVWDIELTEDARKVLDTNDKRSNTNAIRSANYGYTALRIFRAFYGTKCLSAEHCSMSVFADDPDGYYDIAERFCNFVIHYIPGRDVTNAKFTVDGLLNYNVHGWLKNITGRDKMQNGIYSSKYIVKMGGTVHHRSRNVVCQGVLLDHAKLFSKTIPHFYQATNFCTKFYLSSDWTDEDSRATEDIANELLDEEDKEFHG